MVGAYWYYRTLVTVVAGLILMVLVVLDYRQLLLPKVTCNTSKQYVDLPSHRPHVSNVDNVDLPAEPLARNVIAMSLYGSEVRYTLGALANAVLVPKYFPGWVLRIYIGEYKLKPNQVPKSILDVLQALGAEIYIVDQQRDRDIPPMMWRFLVADDVSVDHFIVRDCDSRLTKREADAVHEWLKSGKAFNCMRDHPGHRVYPVNGGLWGGKPWELRKLLNQSFREAMSGSYSDGYLQDMVFLHSVVWPRVHPEHVYCSDSVTCHERSAAFPFPTARNGSDYVGAVYDVNSVRVRDFDTILEEWLSKDDNKNLCTPNTTAPLSALQLVLK